MRRKKIVRCWKCDKFITMSTIRESVGACPDCYKEYGLPSAERIKEIKEKEAKKNE